MWHQVKSAVILAMCLMRVMGSWERSYCTPSQLDQLAYNLCGNRGYAMRCNGTSLKTVPTHFPPPTGNLTPPLCLLDLSNNHIRYVNESSFVNVIEIKLLYLNENEIDYLHTGAFKGLHNLVYLNLSSNNLTCPSSFGEKVFAPLVNLTGINLKNNNFLNFDRLDIEMQYLVNLRTISLNCRFICSFGKGFGNLTKLRNISLSGRLPNACNMSIIGNAAFMYTRGITHLSMSQCSIESIEPIAFAPLQNLKYLDLSYNEKLHFDGMNLALYGLRYSSTIEYLNVNHIHIQYGIGTVLEEAHIENLKTFTRLVTLEMESNKIEVFESSVLYPYKFPQSLRNLSLSGNRLTYGDYVKFLYCVHNLTHLDISNQHMAYAPFGSSSFDSKRFRDASVKPNNLLIPPDLKSWNWRWSFVYAPEVPNLLILGASNLEYVDFSFNLIMQWTGIVQGVEHITHLNLSHNLCFGLSPTFFHTFEGLRLLDIGSNRLGRAFDPKTSKNAGMYFQNLINLEDLDISANQIVELHSDIFMSLYSLEHLDLSKNSLEEFDLTFNTTRCLRSLDLSDNKISSFSKEFLQYLDEMAADKCNDTAHVNLAANPIECTCHTIGVLKWMIQTKIGLHFHSTDFCHLKNGRRAYFTDKSVMSETVAALEKECVNYTWLVCTSVSILTLIISVVVCGLLYRYRWKLRYIYYSRHKRHILEGFERLFDNDAFISYSSTMCRIIKEKFVPELENTHGLKLWVADRNSMPGASKAENIVHAINNSRRSILLIDRNYLKDSWCVYEMNMAKVESIESRRPVIIFVLFDKTEFCDLPVSILRNVQSAEQLEFPTDASIVEAKEFWKALVLAIKLDEN